MDDTRRNIPLSHSRRQKHKNYRHLQTDIDQLALLLVRQGFAAEQLEYPDAWGADKNDHTLRGNRR
jgi:hypothetical protein